MDEPGVLCIKQASLASDIKAGARTDLYAQVDGKQWVLGHFIGKSRAAAAASLLLLLCCCLSLCCPLRCPGQLSRSLPPRQHTGTAATTCVDRATNDDVM